MTFVETIECIDLPIPNAHEQGLVRLHAPKSPVQGVRFVKNRHWCTREPS
jgi:hypothetical protein